MRDGNATLLRQELDNLLVTTFSEPCQKKKKKEEKTIRQFPATVATNETPKSTKSILVPPLPPSSALYDSLLLPVRPPRNA